MKRTPTSQIRRVKLLHCHVAQTHRVNEECGRVNARFEFEGVTFLVNGCSYCVRDLRQLTTEEQQRQLTILGADGLGKATARLKIAIDEIWRRHGRIPLSKIGLCLRRIAKEYDQFHREKMIAFKKREKLEAEQLSREKANRQ